MKKSPARPPQFLLRFFRWFCHPELHRFIEGDLLELYSERLNVVSKRKADFYFFFEVFFLFRPGIIRPPSNTQPVNNYTMIKSYFTIGSRNLLRNKGYSLINIGGLALGMAVAMVIGLWVYDELSFNRYFKNHGRIAQVMKAGQWEGKRYTGQRHLQFPLIEELKTTYGSNFKHVVPISGQGGWEGVLSTGEKKITKTGMYIGEEAPEMFTWKMISGTWSALKDPHSIMLSQSTAHALFGIEEALGKAVKINGTTEVTVSGVFEDFPKNTEFYNLDFFQPWEFYLMDAGWVSQQGWQNHFLYIYVEIQPNKTFEEVAANIKDAEINATRNLDYMKDQLKYNPEILLHPMADWHLYGDFKEGELQHGPIQLVRFIGAIGVFVLLLACINFMNLSTARSEKRAKEVGIRKTIGSVRRQLITQFFAESFLVVLIAFIFAIAIVALTLPWFNLVAAKEMALPLTEKWFWISCLAFIVLTGLLAGSYPALYLSSFNPVKILKGTFRTNSASAWPRRILVVVQFSVSVILAVCTGVIYNQLMYVKGRPVGYDREGLLMIRKKSDAFDKHREALRTELKNSGAVIETAESGGALTSVWSNNGGFTWEGMDPSFDSGFGTLGVSPNIGTTVGWEFVAGRDFSEDIASDSAAIILNESAVEFMNIKDPVGKIIHWKNRAWGMDKDFIVVGVINDMLMESPFAPVRPAIYFTYPYNSVLLLRLNPAMNRTEALAKVEKVFRTIIPDIPFDYKFVDQEFAAKFAYEERIGTLAGVFTILAIIISCLGLFGLASFVAEQRTKEIGVRKVLGASVANLWSMLSRDFVLLVVIACLIAVPVSYFILQSGLKNYEYKTDISWIVFAAVTTGALVITLVTVSFQAIKAALMNPVRSLRSE